MKQKFDIVSFKCSKLTTQSYSTSFSLGIMFLHKTLRNQIYAIYGFVRLADEIVDSFSGYNQRVLLEQFKKETYDAIQNKISLNPILNSFQKVVHDYQIDLVLIETFLKSMEMDLDESSYSRAQYDEYILGSAEVVGLMCLHVFTEGDKDAFQKLKPYAMRLGAAFQKINFLRDVKADYEILGRNYFPNVDLSNFTVDKKREIEDEIANDFAVALEGIKKLPSSSKIGVYLAYIYYVSLFKKIKNISPTQVLKKRIRVSNVEKFLLMINSVFKYKLNLI